MDKKIEISVACARPDDGFWQTLPIEAGASAREAILQSGVLEHFKDLELEQLSIGIFGVPAKLDKVLAPGDRVEIYRALLVDPKTVPKKPKTKNKK